jgi:hypothetical protein
VSEPEGDEPVPKLPRGRGIKLSSPEVFRILLTGGLLVAIIVLTHPCANAVSSFVTSFDNGSAGSAAAAMPKPDNVRPPEPDDTTYVRLRPGMTDEQVKAAIDEARAKAKARAAQGSGAQGSGAQGSGAGQSGATGSGATGSGT